MRIGVLSDAHGNLAGFEAALASLGGWEALLFGGDLLGYYFDSRPVMERLRELGAHCILGNHDACFLSQLGHPVDPPFNAPPAEAYRRRYGPALDLAARELNQDDIAWLRALTPSRRLELGGARILLVHGSPWQVWDEYVYPDHARFGRFAELDDDLVVMGHTHRPLIRTEGRVTLLNPGSCGQPRDSNPAASAAVVRVDDASLRCEIVRAPYDRTRLLNRCRELAPSVPLLTEMLTRGEPNRS